MKLTVSIFIIPAMLFATLAASAGLLSSAPRVGDNLEDPTHYPRALDAMGVGSPCVDSEGAWFCMSSSFQRCASGQWSDVMQCARGTVCQPEGLTYDLQSSSLSSSPSISTSTPTSAFDIFPVTATASTSAAVVTPTPITTTTTSSSGFTSGETTTASTTTTKEPMTTTTTTSCSTGPSTTSCTTSTETSTAHATESTGAPKNDTSGASRAISMGLSWSLVGLFCAASLTEGRGSPL